MLVKRLLILAVLIVIAADGAVFYLLTKDSKVANKPLLTPFKKNEITFNNVAEAEEDTVVVRSFGDMMLDRNVAKVMGSSGLDYIFQDAIFGEKDVFGGVDILTANLEGPFAEKRIDTSKEIAFRFDPKYASQLKEYGFTAFNLANNHSYDMGRKNVAYTRDVLKHTGFGYFGDELEEGLKFNWATSTKIGRIAFVGLHNTYREINKDKTKTAIEQAREGADYVIVNIHWGVEYRATSTSKQQELGRWLIDNGADVVVGHHPHVVEEMEIYKDKPIFYSLGNFIFDQYFSKETQEGLGIDLVFSSYGLLRVELLPFYSERSQIHLMEGERYENFIKDFSNNSRLGGREIKNGIISL